jgi:hypothetical protein
MHIKESVSRDGSSIAAVQTGGEDTHMTLKYEYVTSTVSLLVQAGKGDGIVVAVVNDSAASENTHVAIYLNTGAGATAVAGTSTTIVPNWQWSLGYTVKNSGEYWVRVQTSSEFLVPKVSFERLQNGVWTPVVSYRPGDFAVFQLTPTRTRLW